MNKIITLIPRISEKAYAQSLKENTYVFNIEDGINKIEIKKAVEAQHKVDVLGVRVLVRKGTKLVGIIRVKLQFVTVAVDTKNS